MTQTFRLVALGLALALAVAACGSSTSSPATRPAAAVSAGAPAPARSSTEPASGHATVAIRNYMFKPMHLVVSPGTKVSFHNDDQTAHTATADNHSFDSGTIKPGATVTIAFKKPGTYAYHCLFHAFMTATVKVVAPTS